MTLTQDREEHRIIYAEHEFGGTQIISGPSDRSFMQVVNHHHSKVFLQELKRVLTRQVGILKKLRINSVPLSKEIQVILTRRFENTFRRIVKKRNSKMKIQSIHFELIEYLAIRIFQFLDPLSLKKIGFSNNPGPFYHPDPDPDPEFIFSPAADIDNKDLMETEQWKNAEELFSFQLRFKNIPLKMFTHFSLLDVNLPRVTLEDLKFLKKTYSNSSNFKHAIIHVTKYIDTEDMVPAFGEPFEVHDDDREWYFKCSDCGSALYLYLTRKLLKFVRCPITAVPKGCRMRE
ncbi:hypothetical protein CAEBREN_03553 [Caenorhabditis brenneri]|uniref:DUF38 domain-containing protein n=1 Tax=Caenorhabditis brenneri TaxID=135651 RepID=G0PJW0_CAEBE|nr:hypothetical protein CAEBREN_03553 [Caenorhabditis brenneri]